MFSYLRLLVLLLVLSACSHREKDGVHSLLSFFNKEKAVPELTLPQYKSWLEDTTNHSFVSFENDSFKVSMMYRPASFEAAASLRNSDEGFDTIYKEKNKYHLFVAECLDKRAKSTMKLKGGLEFINKLSHGVYVVENTSDTILPIVEVFPAMLLNKPSYIYMLIPKENATLPLRAGLYSSMLGYTKALSISIDSVQIAHLPKIKL